MHTLSSFQIWNKSGKFGSTDEIDFKVDRVCHEFILSESRAMNQAGNLHLIVRAELSVGKTEMQNSQVMWKEIQTLFWNVWPIAI